MKPVKLVLATLLLLCGPALWAQRTTATLYGSVKDASGAVVPNVQIHASEELTGIRHDTTANDRGDFTLPFLPVGRYSIEAEINGFKTFTQSGIALEAGQEVQLPVRLEVGAMSEKVTVTA